MRRLMSTSKNDEGRAETNVDRQIRANLWVKVCIVFIFVSVSVAFDYEALNCHLNTLVELELAFEASIVSMRFFDIALFETPFFERLNLSLLEDKQKFKLGMLKLDSFRAIVLSPKRKDQIGSEKEPSVCRRAVSRSSTMSPNDPKHDDVGVGRHEVQLERVNPSPSPTHSAQENEWAKAEVVLHIASGCSRGTHLIRGKLLEREFTPAIV
ncbi:hypothetical protein H5410_045329 [Solanum commersonii]|uniref:Uncharacterized protein n=1 Tax=Solanum commersonii TaxID=4109 RepID=A0A9J5XB97_SOLCO|nr:hypothetical protein H5410_045329 [Solanum commersonii]